LETPAIYLPRGTNSDPALRNKLVHTLLPKDAVITDKEIVGPKQVVGPELIDFKTLAENLQIDYNSKKLTILSVAKSNRGNSKIGNIIFFENLRKF
jgi:hypothetical protein